MLLPCETTVKKYLPAIRAGLVKQLSKSNLSQREIARKLGITQAAVNKYLNGNYTKAIKKLESQKKMQKIINKVAASAIKGKSTKPELIEVLCELCESERRLYHG